MPTPTLTERQRRYLETMQANLARNTGKSLDEWVAIARACPETGQRAQLKWLKHNHGLLQNHGLQVLNALAGADRWEDEGDLRAALWSNPASAEILAAVERAVERAVSGAPGLVAGQRKAYTPWSRQFQFAALKPGKGGTAILGLAVTPDASPRLAPPKNEGWSERLTSKVTLASPAEVDSEIEALLRAAWEIS